MEHKIPLITNYKFCVYRKTQSANYHEQSTTLSIPIPILLSKVASDVPIDKETLDFIDNYKTVLFREDLRECTLKIEHKSSTSRDSSNNSLTKTYSTWCCLSGPFFSEVAQIVRTYKFATLSVTVALEECGRWRHEAGSENKLEDIGELAPRYDINTNQPVTFEVYLSKKYILPVIIGYIGRVSLTLNISGIPPGNFRKSEGPSDTSFLKSHSMHIRNLLKNHINTDVTLVSSSGTELKCHKLILTGCSPVFNAMFSEKKFQESSSCQVVIENCSESEIAGFLAYVYGDSEKFMVSTEKFEDSFGILQMAKTYEVKPLKDILIEQMLSKQRSWFSDAALLEVFAVSADDADLEVLKKYVGNLIKSGFQKIQGMEFFMKWFSKHPAAAIQLCSFAITS